MSKYEVISGPYFPAFGLNTEIYGVNQSECRKIRTRNNLNLRIQSECRKIRTKNIFVFGHFTENQNFKVDAIAC